jgi:hypothetical protein
MDDEFGTSEVSYLKEYVNYPVGNICAYTYCDITFYGVNNLEYNAQFRAMSSLWSGEFAIDYDNDGDKDSILYKVVNQKHTVTFDLPFEPYGFSLVYDGNHVDRIF